MSDQQPEEHPRDWMEVWYETGEITWQKPLSPEANERIQNLFNELREEQKRGEDPD